VWAWKDREEGKMLLETKWWGEARLGDEHYWDWEKRTEKNALRPRRTGGYIGQRRY
jgi:hypothetical protein